MKIEKRVLARVEGTAYLELEWKDGVISDARVIVAGSRGLERVLEGRPVADALVITPRVCGICGHAHLIASVSAIENALGNPQIPKKAELLRKVTLNLERLQNHIKWFYLFLLPDFLRLGEKLKDFEPYNGLKWKKAISLCADITKAIALFAGQWPHSSYAVPGGVTSQPDNHQIHSAMQIVHKVKDFFLEDIVGMVEDEYKKVTKTGLWESVRGDCGMFIEITIKHGLDWKGRSYGRMITSEQVPSCNSPAKVISGRRLYPADYGSIQVFEGETYSQTQVVRYRGVPCETGPIARGIASGNRIVNRLYKTYHSSFMSRTLARLLETWDLLIELENTLKELPSLLKEPSCLDLMDKVKKLSGEGVAFVEASRGMLLHSVRTIDGKIAEYRIITPSMWNLGPRCKRFLGVAEKSMLNLDNPIHAEMILKSFDACSVCTVR
ncbi:nickel-dependent hydrogenase large subunit [Thermocrinis sp.]